MSSGLLHSLPARPPTPPREAIPESDIPPVQRPLVCPALDPRLSLQTPPNAHSPKSGSTKSTNPSSQRGGKIVAFSAKAEYKEPPVYPDAENHSSKSCPPLARPSKPTKSILKPSLSPNPLGSSLDHASSPITQTNLAAMLESSIKHLAGPDRLSKCDAYMSLSNALRASNNLPDRVALQDRMSLFMHFIQRDVAPGTSPSSPPDFSLANHALTLLITFLHFPAIASALSTEFSIFIMDHCIRSFESALPKDVIRHLLQVVAQQNFSLRVMTSDRVGRLVAALHNIEKHATGKSILHSRIIIYRRLITQCKAHMIVHAADWLADLFTDLLSTSKDIRSAAVVLGFDAAFALGSDKFVSRKVVELFQLSVNEKKYIDFYIDRLNAVLRSRQDTASVPRIWSIVPLFLRGIQLEKWQYLNPWLLIIQSSFNMSDPQTKHEANFAWNRFVYAIHLDEHSFTKMLASTLCQPVSSQLRRKPVGSKGDKEFRRVVLGSVCNLYYYAFKPGVGPILLDKHWQASIKPIMKQLTVDAHPDVAEEYMNHAIASLTGLFDSTTRRQWSEDRVAANTLATPAELPQIDSRWLRRNAAGVFHVVQPILETRFADLSVSDSPTTKMWNTLISSVSSAATKEVKVSLDTTEFVAQFLTCIVKIWKRGIPNPDKQGGQLTTETFLGGVQHLIKTVVGAFGQLPFTEKQLCNREDRFSPISTPSHRSKVQGVLRTPLQHLFSILSCPPTGIEDDAQYVMFFDAVFEQFFTAKNHHVSFDFALEMFELIPADAPCSSGAWLFISGIISRNLHQISAQDANTSSSSSRAEVTVGREYRGVVRVLERGLKSPRPQWSGWDSLFSAFSDHVSHDVGHAGRALAVIEPLAKAMLDHMAQEQAPGVSTVVARATTALLSQSAHPRDRQALDAARRRLWGVGSVKSATFDPFDNLYKLTSTVLGGLYQALSSPGGEMEGVVAPFMTELAGFLERCNLKLVMKSISQLQEGVAIWIQDEDSRLSSRQRTEMAESVKILWERMCTILTAQEQPDQIPLSTLEQLICAAFQSRHRHVINTMSMTWNRIFDNVEEIQYPENMKPVLLSLRSVVDIVLPGLGEASAGSEAQHLSFVESQDDLDALDLSALKSVRSEQTGSHEVPSRSSPRPVSRRSLASPSFVSRTRSGVAHGKTSTPDLGPRKKEKRVAKLRHDDSQIQFASVASFPTDLNADESQLLTERQQEVRERQREEGALYREVQTSPMRDATAIEAMAEDQVDSPALPAARQRHSTPEPDPSFAAYVSSTPTPRRGQPLLPDQDMDMTDAPSSPPEGLEGCRYPSVPLELRPRPSSAHEIAWEFSSSPISGSPISAQKPSEACQPVAEANPQDEHEKVLSEPTDSIIADSFVAASASEADIQESMLPAARASTPEIQADAAQAPPSTPQRPSPKMYGGETPKSETDEFVDALTSPQLVSPRPRRSTRLSTTQGKDRRAPSPSLFPLSAGEERSLLRIAVEIDAKQIPSSRKTVLDCITVHTSDLEPEDTTTVSTPDKAPTSTTNSSDSVSGGSGRRKRKRRSSSRQRDRRNKKSRSAGKGEGPGYEPESPIPNMDDADAASEVADSNDITTSSPEKRTARPETRSSLPSTPVRKTTTTGGDTDETEAESQLVAEHLAASASRPRATTQKPADDLVMDSQPLDSEVDMGDAAEQTVAQATTVNPAVPAADMISPAKASEETSGNGGIKGLLQLGLQRLRAAHLSREEMYEIEDMFSDFKRELYEAERRGRQMKE